jgi:hypothetical protein
VLDVGSSVEVCVFRGHRVSAAATMGTRPLACPAARGGPRPERDLTVNRPSLTARFAACAAVLLATAALVAPVASASRSAAPSARVGFPTYLKGMVVNSSTGAQVSGILVTLRDPVSLDLIASDTTNANGVFRMDGLHSDEYGIKFNGSRRGYETGWGGCGHGVVPTFGEACTFAPGGVGKFRLDRL